ncbi:MAG: DUF2934 domain-containing protein [Alphaproteobacteria bacterium]
MSKSDINEEHVRVAAYYIWEKEGRPEGVDFDHWVKAKNAAAEAEGCCKSSCCASTDTKAKATKAKSAPTATKTKAKKK